MADAANLRELADRCEAATGADRELDAAIYEALAEAIDYQRIGIRLPIEKWPDRYHDGWVTVYGSKGENDPYPEELRRYSASLDAAMSLVPEADAVTAPFWKVGNDGEGGDPSLFKAVVLVAGVFTSKQSIGLADTPALALCAAAIRARADHLQSEGNR